MTSSPMTIHTQARNGTRAGVIVWQRSCECMLAQKNGSFRYTVGENPSTCGDLHQATSTPWDLRELRCVATREAFASRKERGRGIRFIVHSVSSGDDTGGVSPSPVT